MTNTIGAIISVIASVLSNIGTNIQKEAHIQNADRDEDDKIPYVKSWLWWFGLLGVVTGAIGDFVAFSLASQELVVAVGCAAVLVCNVAVSTIWHKEAMGWTDLVGIVCVLTAAVIFALNAPKTEDFSSSELADKFQRHAFVFVLVFQMVCMLVLLSGVSSSTIFAMRIKCQYRCFRHLFRRYDKVEKQNEALIEQCKLLDHRLAHVEHQLRQGSAASTLTLERGMSVIPFQGGSSPTRLSHSFRSPHGAWDRDHGENKLPMRNTGFADPSLHRSNMLSKEMLIDEGDREDNQHWDPYIYAACSGTAGGMMALFAGCASKALKQTFEGDNQFDSPWTYLFICGLGAFIFAQTHFLNRAMIEGDLMSVIPTFQAFWIVFGVVSGMAFYNNSSGMSFPGLILMIAGVLFLLQHPQVLAGVDVLGVKGCCIRIAPWCGCGGCWADQQPNDQEADGQVEFQDVENVMPPPNSSLEDIVKEDQNPVREESNEALSRPLPESPPPKLTPIAAQAEVYKGATVVPQIETIDIEAPAEP